MMERHMASHSSVTRCDVSAPYRHIVTSRHTPLRGVTDVTCDAGDHRSHRRASGRTTDRAISAENIKTQPTSIISISTPSYSIPLTGLEPASAPPTHSGRSPARSIWLFPFWEWPYRGRDTYV